MRYEYDDIKFGTIVNIDNTGIFGHRAIAIHEIRSTLGARDLDLGTLE